MRPRSMIAMRSQSASASFEIVRRQQHRVPVVLHLRDLAVQLAPRLRIEPGGRLVEEDELGLVDERQRQRQPLPLSARQRVERRVGFLDKGEALEQRRRLGPSAVERAEERERLARRDLVLQRRRLERRADLLFHLARPPPRIDAADLDRPRRPARAGR